MGETFAEVKRELIALVRPGVRVPNWSKAAEKNPGRLKRREFVVLEVDKAKGLALQSGEKRVEVPWGALENVWRKWRDYRECRLKRKDLAEKNFFTTYCIALLRFLEENLGGPRV